MADKDRALELARSYNPAEFKMRSMGDIYSDARRAVADKYNAFMGSPIVQAFGEEPLEMTKAVGEAGWEGAKQLPGMAKAAANYAYENPSKAAGSAVEFAAGMSPNPVAMFLWGPGGFLSPSTANASELDPQSAAAEHARQQIMNQEAQMMRDENYAGGYCGGGEVRQAHADGRAALPLLAKGESLLTKLAKEALERRGAQTAMRVERAADEIPNLERHYTPEALRQALLSKEGLVMTMKPSDFQNFALQLPPQEAGQFLKAAAGELPSKMTDREEYLRYLSQFPVVGGGGFKEVPSLRYADTGEYPAIRGHEGRHRMLTLEGMNEPSTLVSLDPHPYLKDDLKDQLQELFPYKNPYDDERLITRFKSHVYENPKVIPEGRSLDDFNLIDLPEPYAKGGKAR